MFPIIDSFIRRRELSDIFLFLCNWVFLLFKIKWFIRTDTLWVSNIYGDWRITAQETGTVSKIYQQAGGGIHPLTTIADIANQTYSVKCTDIFWNCWGQGALKYYVSNVNTAAAGEGGRAVCETYVLVKKYSLAHDVWWTNVPLNVKNLKQISTDIQKNSLFDKWRENALKLNDQKNIFSNTSATKAWTFLKFSS